MDPFAKGNADSKKIDPNHYIPKAEWEGICSDTVPEGGVEKVTPDDTKPGKVRIKGKGKGEKAPIKERWQNTPKIYTDDATGEEFIYQICVAPPESPNFKKGRWVAFDDAIY